MGSTIEMQSVFYYKHLLFVDKHQLRGLRNKGIVRCLDKGVKQVRARLFSSTKDFVSVLVPLEGEANADIFREFNIVHLKYFNVKIRILLKIIHSFEINKFIFDYGFFKPKDFFLVSVFKLLQLQLCHKLHKHTNIIHVYFFV